MANLHYGNDLSRTTVQVKKAILERLSKTLGAARVRLAASQRHYQADFDRKVRNVGTVVAGDELFVDIALKTKMSMWEATRLDKSFEPSWRISAKANGPHELVRATLGTVPIDRDGLGKTI